MAELVPAILAKSLSEFEQKVRQVEDLVDSVQIDVMDGKFVPNTTYNEVNQIAAVKTDLQYEIHLMISDVTAAIKNWAKLEPTRITFHIEAVTAGEVKEIITGIKTLGVAEVGLALNPDTELTAIEPFLDKINFVLVMGVNPGFSGQKFQEMTLKRVRKIKSNQPDMKVGVDGGVNIKNAEDLIAAGADELAIGSAIFASSDVRAAVEELRRVCRTQTSE